MKRFWLGTITLGLVAVLGGCPIYSSQNSGTPGSYQVCNRSGCYDCPDPTYSSACTPWTCGTSADCPAGYACGANATCVPGGSNSPETCSSPAQCPSGSVCGEDGTCRQGDCGSWGCVSGYVCRLSGGVATCVASGQGPDAGNDGGGADASSGNDAGSDGGGPSDAGSSGPCNADLDCTGSGAKCIDGQCTAQGGLCSDTTQCVVAGEACVDGVCEPHCSSGVPCPAGYECDFPRGVCNLNPSACAGSGTSSCLGGSVCVETHCVSPCAAGDAAACPSGQVCVNGGCIPDEAASFPCTNDGESGQLAHTCDPASVCLHHDCYVACDPDAGTCAGQTVCKPVRVSAGTYNVCGGTSNLGSDCDPASGNYCSSGVCIDGYCL